MTTQWDWLSSFAVVCVSTLETERYLEQVQMSWKIFYVRNFKFLFCITLENFITAEISRLLPLSAQTKIWLSFLHWLLSSSAPPENIRQIFVHPFKREWGLFEIRFKFNYHFRRWYRMWESSRAQHSMSFSNTIYGDVYIWYSAAH